MARHYSPNHPAVRSWTGEPRQTVRERTAAVRARRGIPDHGGKTGDRLVIAISTFVLALGLAEARPLWAIGLLVITAASAWPWLRETQGGVFPWRR